MKATQALLQYLPFSGYSPTPSRMSPSFSAQALEQLETIIQQNLRYYQQRIDSSRIDIGGFMASIYHLDDQLGHALQ